MAQALRDPTGHPIYAVRWSPDGARLATASRRLEHYHRYHDLSDVEDRLTWSEQFQAAREEYRNARGTAWGYFQARQRERLDRMLDEEDQGAARIWDVTSGKVLLTYRGHRFGATDIAWSPDGRRLATSGGREGAAHVWDAASGETLVMLLDESAAAWAREMRLLTSQAAGSPEASAANRQRRYEALLKAMRIGQWAEAVGWSADGERIASTNARLAYVWSASSGQRLLTYGCHRGPLEYMALAPDGTKAASVTSFVVQVWDAAIKGRALLMYQKHRGEGSDVVALAWSPNSARVASGTSTGLVHVWDAATGETALVFRGHAPPGPPPITQAANADFRELMRRELQFAKYGTLSYTYVIGRTYAVYALAWSPDGTRIASGGWDRTVRIWDAHTGEERQRYIAHEVLISALAWSPDGSRIASADRDGAIHIWPAG